MKIKEIKIKNLGKIHDINIEFDKRITRLVGINGSGKTSVINAIWAAFKGIAQKGKECIIAEKYRMIGAVGKSADIILTLIDEKERASITLNRHFTKSSNTISFEGPDGYKINEQWLTDLLDVTLMSASRFCMMSGKDQALALGIDTAEYDMETEKLKENASYIRRDIRAFGDILPVMKVDEVSLSELLKERDQIKSHNAIQENIKSRVDQAKHNVEFIKEELEVAKKKIDMANEKLEEAKKDLNSLPEPLPEKDTASIDEQIKNAEQTNTAAREYKTFIEKKKEKEKKEEDLLANLNLQKETENRKISYVASQKFKVENIEVDETGALMCNGKPIRPPYFSTGELEMIVARLAESTNPELKVRIVDNFENLDEGNQQKLIDELTGAGFQLIVTEVGNRKEKSNTILLRDCSVMPPSVREYDK